MQLVLIRHGIAIDRDDPACPEESERYLTDEGVERTNEAMAGLRQLGVEPDAVLSSPYVRALQTARIACERLGHDPKKIRTTKALLPEAEPRELFRQLTEEDARTVFCCGHAPNLDELIAHAVGAEAAFTSMKKAGAACLEMEKPRAESATLVWLYPAGTLRKLGG